MKFWTFIFVIGFAACMVINHSDLEKKETHFVEKRQVRHKQVIAGVESCAGVIASFVGSRLGGGGGGQGINDIQYLICKIN